MSSSEGLRSELAAFVGFSVPPAPRLETRHEERGPGYTRALVSYRSPDGDDVPAYLLVPDGDGPFPAVICHHQHNSEIHIGKSEPAGLAGDPLQAFGPALARRGIIVLAPDSICFEDRRPGRHGREPHPDDGRRHFDELCYRLLRGDTLARKVVSDSALGLSLLAAMPIVDRDDIGLLGHSYGGNTVLFHAPLDHRVRFACSSGAACSFRQRIASGTGIELASVIPGFLERFELGDLVAGIAPAPLLLVSATRDPYSEDADAIEAAARRVYAQLGANHRLEHRREDGGHDLSRTRFERIVSWTVEAAHGQAPA